MLSALGYSEIVILFALIPGFFLDSYLKRTISSEYFLLMDSFFYPKLVGVMNEVKVMKEVKDILAFNHANIYVYILYWVKGI